MVRTYIPDAGNIVWLNFDPQAGREQARRRPALVLTDLAYNRRSLAVVCPLASRRKPYPFTVLLTIDDAEGAVLVDHLKSVDLGAHEQSFTRRQIPSY
jgi:mRNA interferase MazF